jgi:drug/metabolite transporter (DMT)-like permease
MPLSIALLVLFAALLHACWNALLKGGGDGLWSMTIMGLATSLACLVALPFLPMPSAASWPYLLASALLHMGYNAFLIRAYRQGDFGSAYPIARGSSPMLVTLGALLVSGEQPALIGMAGIALVSIGIISLAFRGRRLPESGIFYAMGTGLFIAAYTVVDGMGGRLSGHAIAYTAWMCLLWGITAVPVWLLRRPGEKLWRGVQKTGVAAASGVLSVIAYGIVIFAMTRAPMGSVSALRETSVLSARP